MLFIGFSKRIMKYSAHIIGCILLILLYTCCFEPHDEFFTEIDQHGTIPDVEVNLNTTDDTIYICQNERVNFSYIGSSDAVQWAQFIINGIESPILKEKSGIIEFSWFFDDFVPGSYPMTMLVFTSSGTGSIADKTGYEGFLLSFEWTIVITDEASMTPDITSLKFVDGYLTVEWEKFKGINFQQLDIYRRIPAILNELVHVATITDPEQMSYVDKNYHGEISHYYIVVNDYYFSNECPIAGPVPQVNARNNENGDIILNWDIPPYYKSLKGYRITFTDGVGPGILEITDPEIDSCMIPDPVFAYEYNIYLSPLPLSNSYYDSVNLHYFLSSNVSACYGKPSEKFRIAKCGTGSLLFFLYDPLVIIYDSDTHARIGSVGQENRIFSFNISSNEDYLLCRYLQEKKVLLLEPAGGTLYKDIDLSALYQDLGYYLAISHNGTGILVNNKTLCLYDFINEIPVAQAELVSGGLYSCEISSSGRFFFCNTWNGREFFLFDEGQIESLAGPEDNIMFAAFWDHGGEKLVLGFSNHLEVWDCENWEIADQWSFNKEVVDYYNLDGSEKKLFLRQGNDLMLFDIVNGSITAIGTISPESYATHCDLIYKNGNIFWSEGYQIEVSQ